MVCLIIVSAPDPGLIYFKHLKSFWWGGVGWGGVGFLIIVSTPGPYLTRNQAG